MSQLDGLIFYDRFEKKGRNPSKASNQNSGFQALGELHDQTNHAPDTAKTPLRNAAGQKNENASAIPTFKANEIFSQEKAPIQLNPHP